MATGLPFPTGAQLPTTLGQPTRGFATPRSDTRPQVVFVQPRRLIPIVFLPGIMGSNLRLSTAERIRLLRRNPNEAEANIAWRPDAIGIDNVNELSNLATRDRQLLLDPKTTALDTYNPHSDNPELDGDERHGDVKLEGGEMSSMLLDDPVGINPRRTAAQKARERGWGEVMFSSYGPLLQRLERSLHRIWRNGQLVGAWRDVVGVNPSEWMQDPSTPQTALTEDEVRQAVRETWFPVHAMGYNWLQDNGDSAKIIAKRIRDLVAHYKALKFDCPGVILVTHSMGGLLGRAVAHPKIGNAQDLILGVVHGAQPATGAAAAYKRLRAGVEDPGLMSTDLKASVTAKILGNFADEVTAVLANSPGALQLLPSQAYGTGWLRVEHQGRVLGQWPLKDPYEEIYKLQGKWWGLIPNEAWVNPSQLPPNRGGSTLKQTHEYLDKAKTFHADLGHYYHPVTFAHYGADNTRRAFGNVTWRLHEQCQNPTAWATWPILGDSRQGVLDLVRYTAPHLGKTDPAYGPNPGQGSYYSGPITATLQPPDEAGDQTVPMRSADHQLRHGRCHAVFRQVGYEHQASYKDERVLAATLYSVLRIALKHPYKP